MNILVNRRCGFKIKKLWFLTVHEVYYLMNFDQVELHIALKNEINYQTLCETYNLITYNSFWNHESFSKHFDEIMAYISLRN